MDRGMKTSTFKTLWDNDRECEACGSMWNPVEVDQFCHFCKRAHPVDVGFTRWTFIHPDYGTTFENRPNDLDDLRVTARTGYTMANYGDGWVDLDLVIWMIEQANS